MAGRGYSLKSFLSKKDESDTQSEASSVAPSPASTASTVTAGRGRGLSLNALFGQPPSEAGSSTATAASVTTSFSSLAIGRGRGIGRGMFSLSKPPSDSSSVATLNQAKGSSGGEGSEGSKEKTQEDSSGLLTKEKTIEEGTGSTPSKYNIQSGSSGGPSKEKAQDASSGIVAGRGISASSAGSVSSATNPPVNPPRPTGAIPKTRAYADPVPVQKPEEKQVKQRGTNGTPFNAVTNSMMIYCDKNTGVYEYEVRFQPGVDNLKFRYKYMKDHESTIGTTKTFDGTILFLPKKLPDETTFLKSKSEVDGSDISIEVKFKRQKALGDCIQLYNILFGRVYRVLNYLRVGRKMFDPTAPQQIPRQKLEVWPGYISSVDELDGGLMLTTDVSFRVLATRTVLEVMIEAYQTNRNNFKEVVKKSLIGKMALTRYNNKTYRIDDVAFDKSPKDTFEYGGQQISYIDYYKKQYNVNVKDISQPLLISRKEVRISGEPEKRAFVFCLIPELCYMTGLSDDMMKTFSVMKDVATYTRITPMQRVGAYKKFLINVNETAEAKKILTDWGLSLDTEPLKVTARLLNEEQIIFGGGRQVPTGEKADFSRHAASNEVLQPIDLVDWLLVYCKSDKKEADSFMSVIMQISGPTGIIVSPPQRIELLNDRNDTYVNEIRRAVQKNPKIQIVAIIFPSLKDDRYAAVKTLLCAEVPVPSQVINSKTLRNETKNRSIIQKILLQMNCKLGGTLWGIKIPMKKAMICGIDTFHEVGLKGKNVAGFVASLNPEFTRWWSKPTIQDKREELVNGLTASMEAALVAYNKFNNFFPDRIILYRDGVGDGQLNFVKTYEIPQFKEAFKRISPDYKPDLTFVVVQKRISTKFFKIIDEKTGETIFNPKPGAILDHTVTSQFMYNYYLIPQHVTQGSVTPSHYVVLEDQNNFKVEVLHTLTYRLCFMYYNWPGTVRVPAPCQYAHKLADLVGNSIKRQVDDKLADKLYFL